MIEVLKQSAEDVSKVYDILAFGHTERALEILAKTRTSLRQAIAELESQEPVAWMDADGNVSDNNDHKCFPIPLYTHPPQRTEQNFCPRCGKRTNDIHTCTPPQIKTTDKFESAKVEDYNRGWNDCFFASGIVKQSQRTWIGLTDEVIDKAIEAHWGEMKGAPLVMNRQFARAIEAKLKEKNT
jgi:hypothetical protein